MAHTLRTLLMTPTGPVPLADLKEGDEIYGVDGNPQKLVSKVSRGVQEVYSITSDDGYTFEATGGQSICLYMPAEQDVTVEEAKVGSTETHVMVPPLLTTFEFKSPRETTFPPFLLGRMLNDPEPLKGYVTITPDPYDLYTQWLPVPNMVAQTDEDNYRMVYTEESIKMFGVNYELLQEAGLFSGNLDEFSIPDEYLWDTLDKRRSLIGSLIPMDMMLSAAEQTNDKMVAALPLDHPGFGNQLKFIAISAGLGGEIQREYSEIERTYRFEEVWDIQVSNPDGGYILDGFLGMRNVEQAAESI